MNREVMMDSVRTTPRPRTIRREQESRFGTQMTRDGVRFRLWAPFEQQVAIELDGQRHVMRSQRRGWHSVEVAGAQAGGLYKFILGDGSLVPDPASRFQPQDVHGPSEIIDPLAYEWHDLGWGGFPWEECVLSELHIGTFTPEGTYAAAARQLPQLRDTGINTVSLMPLNDFPGRFNWGYDGVKLYAPDSTCGRPDDLKAFVDTAHALSMMVLLDVVYNHFGPEGNYLGRYAPLYSARETAYGRGINTDGEGAVMMREFFLSNARYWINEYRFDGLRLDAVHEIKDSSERHLLQDIVEQLRHASDGRHTHIIVENSDNTAAWLTRRDDHLPRYYTAQWNDDLHHALHAAATGESHGYYRDFAGRCDLAARALAEGFGWQGEWMAHEARHKGAASAFLPPTAFVAFFQNHDHIGNRNQGERLNVLAPPEAVRALTALLLLSPQIPLLFMGQEWGSTSPFCYFTDFDGALAEAVRQSRRRQLADAPCDPRRGEPPDPVGPEAFEVSKLDWAERATPQGKANLDLHRQLIALRRAEIIPRLKCVGAFSGGYTMLSDTAFHVQWRLDDRSMLHMAVNLSRDSASAGVALPGRILWQEGEVASDRLGPWSLQVAMAAE